MLDEQHHQKVFSAAYNSDSEILAALQTMETVVRTQRHRLDADRFPMFSVGWTWQGFRRDLDHTLPVGLSSGVVTTMRSVDLRTSL